MKLEICQYDRKREVKKKKSVRKKCEYFYYSENFKQFVSLDRPGFKLVERMLPVTVSQGLLIWECVD